MFKFLYSWKTTSLLWGVYSLILAVLLVLSLATGNAGWTPFISMAFFGALCLSFLFWGISRVDK